MTRKSRQQSHGDRSQDSHPTLTAQVITSCREQKVDGIQALASVCEQILRPYCLKRHVLTLESRLELAQDVLVEAIHYLHGYREATVASLEKVIDRAANRSTQREQRHRRRERAYGTEEGILQELGNPNTHGFFDRIRERAPVPSEAISAREQGEQVLEVWFEAQARLKTSHPRYAQICAELCYPGSSVRPRRFSEDAATRGLSVLRKSMLEVCQVRLAHLPKRADRELYLELERYLQRTKARGSKEFVRFFESMVGYVTWAIEKESSFFTR